MNISSEMINTRVRSISPESEGTKDYKSTEFSNIKTKSSFSNLFNRLNENRNQDVNVENKFNLNVFLFDLQKTSNVVDKQNDKQNLSSLNEMLLGLVKKISTLVDNEKISFENAESYMKEIAVELETLIQEISNLSKGEIQNNLEDFFLEKGIISEEILENEELNSIFNKEIVDFTEQFFQTDINNKKIENINIKLSEIEFLDDKKNEILVKNYNLYDNKSNNIEGLINKEELFNKIQKILEKNNINLDVLDSIKNVIEKGNFEQKDFSSILKKLENNIEEIMPNSEEIMPNSEEKSDISSVFNSTSDVKNSTQNKVSVTPKGNESFPFTELKNEIQNRIQSTDKFVFTPEKVLIQLNPKGLGEIELFFKKTDNGLEIFAEVEKKEVKSDLEKIFEDIKKDFKEKNSQITYDLKDRQDLNREGKGQKQAYEQNNKERNEEFVELERNKKKETDFASLMKKILGG